MKGTIFILSLVILKKKKLLNFLFFFMYSYSTDKYFSNVLVLHENTFLPKKHSSMPQSITSRVQEYFWGFFFVLFKELVP